MSRSTSPPSARRSGCSRDCAASRAGAAQLTPSAPGGRHLREKIAVLGSFADQALLSTPAFDERAVLRAVADEAARSCPGTFVVATTHRGRDRGSTRRCSAGRSTPARRRRRRPVDRRRSSPPCPPRDGRARCSALAFEEDFAVLDGASATIPWLAVCLPSRWAPEDKVGRHFAAVHAPVADNEMLVAASASLARLVTGDERWERFVWTISADPRLHQHPARGDADWPAASEADADALVAHAFFRSERQTFIPIAGSGQAIFTIHVDERSARRRRDERATRRAGCTTRSPACRPQCSPTAASTARAIACSPGSRRARRPTRSAR